MVRINKVYLVDTLKHEYTIRVVSSHLKAHEDKHESHLLIQLLQAYFSLVFRLVFHITLGQVRRYLIQYAMGKGNLLVAYNLSYLFYLELIDYSWRHLHYLV